MLLMNLKIRMLNSKWSPAEETLMSKCRGIHKSVKGLKKPSTSGVLIVQHEKANMWHLWPHHNISKSAAGINFRTPDSLDSD